MDIRPSTYITVLLNRNYVLPRLNDELRATAKNLPSDIKIRYLDANFPFINGFPLFPHLSHNDGKKIDLSFVYDKDNKHTTKQKSRTGYGVFEEPTNKEWNQTKHCKKKGHWQYDFTKYVTLGSINDDLIFSNKGT